MYFLPLDAPGRRSFLHPVPVIGAFLIMLAATAGLFLIQAAPGSVSGPTTLALAAVGALAVAVGVLLVIGFLTGTVVPRRRLVISGLVLLNLLPLAAVVASTGKADARHLLLWLVLPTLIAAGTHDERLHRIQLCTAGIVACAVVLAAGQGVYGTLIDLCVVLGALAVLDVLVRGLSLSMAARLAESRRLSVSDGLTGILNRRGLMAGVPDLSARADRLGTCVGVLLVDIDRFKEINDRYGHGQGDLVLQRVCRSIADCLPDGDLLARTGGEEMVVVVAGPAEPVATAIRQAVAGASLDPAVTVSVGFVEAGPADCQPVRRLWDLVAAADRGLYAAKTEGRDCIRRGPVLDRIHPERIAADRRETDRLDVDRLDVDRREEGGPAADEPRPRSAVPGRMHDTLFGWALLAFNLAAALAIATGRVRPPGLLTPTLWFGVLAGLGIGVILLTARPRIPRAALAGSVVAIDALIAIVIATAVNPHSRQLGLLTVVIPAVAAALYLGRWFNVGHQLAVLGLCTIAAYRAGIDPLKWGLATILSAAALLSASALIFYLRRRHDEAVARLHHWSTRDPLTGLINRRGLDLAFGQQDRRRPVAVIALDVDEFKLINDRFGHAAGDEALARLADGLAPLADQRTLAARTGGDEFVVVSTSLDSRSLTDRLREALADLPMALTVSIGRIDIPAGSTAGLWELVSLADQRLTVAKSARRAIQALPGRSELTA
ncbi:MAG TPA: diguanylate cyclase [Nakamurella sp.]|nr:diguanylate cyclase [Nakamurella sp.]